MTGRQVAKRRTDDAIDRIRELIVTGELAPGSKLPREPELASQLGISRSSMREAITALTHAQVLDVRRGDGMYVTDLAPDRLFEGIGLAVELTPDRALPQILEVRRLLEPPTAALAATLITPEQLAGLRDCLERMRDAGTPEELVVHDADFHDRIARATGNLALASILHGLSAPTVRLRAWRAQLRADIRDATVEQHAAILDALERRNPALAQASALMHVAYSEDGLLRAVDQAPLSDQRESGPDTAH